MHVLLTGATGYIGKHVLYRLLLDGHRVTAIVRPRGGHAGERVRDALRPLAAGGPVPDDKLDILAGDISKPNCGLNRESLAGLRQCRPEIVIHCAGLTRFQQHLSREIFLVNLDGTRHVHSLGETLGARAFRYVSTAFVAGTTDGLFGANDFALGQNFNNPYEASKFAAEAFLRSVSSRMATRIYRPSVVVGGYPIGANCSVSTIYTFIKALHFLRQCCQRDSRNCRRFSRYGVKRHASGFHIPLRVSADPTTAINLIAVDDVVKVVTTDLAAPVYAIGTVQITGTDVRLGTLRDAICSVMKITGPIFVDKASFNTYPRNPVETHFHRVTGVYEPYLFRSPRFPGCTCDTAVAVEPSVVTREFLQQLDPGNGASIAELGLAVAGVSTARDYFDALVRSAVGQHFLKRYNFIDARVRFQISGVSPFDEIICFKRGRARYADSMERRNPDCSFRLADTMFVDIVSGKMDLRAAFFSGKVDIEGNKELGLKFGAMLGMYYQNINENIIAEITV